ncbi:hypothetical protein [Dactylosporangium sp. NPDC005555]|uniref:hypothetical protein n=1 Tax=Dactylosporangium sp. NPDC005555 TaxID=3154889 RepID=UPI0033BA9D77
MRALRTARRFAVPHWMIERATAGRLAGDWRAACAAANVDVELDDERAELFGDDLAHFAPDLLRWHQFQAPPATAGLTLAVHGRQALRVRPKHPGTPSRRLELVSAPHDGSAAFPRERWDSRCTGELLERCGGYDGHLPGFTDTADRLPPAAWTDRERIIAAQDVGDWVLAWTLAGFDVGPLRAEISHGQWLDLLMRAGTHNLPQLRADAVGRRELVVRIGGHGGYQGVPLRIDADLRVWRGAGVVSPAEVPAVRAERPVDFDLVRRGILPLEDLHPLVGDALFPGLAGLFEGTPETVPDMAPVRVRCQGEWHILGGHRHTAEETRRKLALRALGGAPLRGCLAARAGWRDPDAWTPKALRLRRRDIVLHAVNGDGPAIAAWLDAGLDPHLLDHEGRTMLHLIAWLPDPGPVLARLRHAGLDPDARDRSGLTPLEHALTRGGTPAAIHALRGLGGR